jgi:hypothetical protein
MGDRRFLRGVKFFFHLDETVLLQSLMWNETDTHDGIGIKP